MKGQRMAALTLLLFLFGSMLCGFSYAFHWNDTYAYTNQQAVLNEADVYVRSGAGTTYSAIKSADGQTIFLQTGDSVTITGEATASDGSLWYKVSFLYSQDGNSYQGYVYGAFLTIVSSGGSGSDTTFEEKLEQEGFPESYKVKLRALHALYPNWEFQADNLNYTWEEALENQSIVGRSLVPATSVFSWKSTKTGAYDWKTDTWYGMDGSSWVAASEEIVAYCMDPRNFLDATQIFQFELLSYDASGHTKQGVDNVIDGSFMDGNSVTNLSGATVSYSQALLDAAKVSGVSPYHLASRILQEIGASGQSGSISGTYSGYEGYYNYYNIGAYASGGKSAIENGLIYASKTDEDTYRPWNSRYKAILGGAVFIGDGYINIGQDTLYYEKFDYVGTPYTHQYMTNVLAPQSEAKLSAEAYTEDMKKNSSFVFKIPVFKNMPDTAAEKPTSDKNTNAYLNTLSVNGQSLTPSFSYQTTSYTISVGNSVSSVTVSAKAASSKSSVSGTGSHSLKVGTNTINVVVTAESGAKKTYAIKVIRAEAPTTQQPTTPSPTQKPTTQKPTTQKPTQSTAVSAKTGFTIVEGSYLTGISYGMTVSSVLGKGSYTNCTAKVVNSSGSAKSGSQTAATGDRLVITQRNGSVYASYTLLIYGDPSGDGKISVKDILLSKKYILNGSGLSGVMLKAADVDKNGSISVRDLLLMKYQIIGKKTISQ